MHHYCLVYDSVDILQGGDITDYFDRIRIGCLDRAGDLHPDEIFPDFATVAEARQAALPLIGARPVPFLRLPWGRSEPAALQCPSRCPVARQAARATT